jgi:hypothetical protein
MGIAWWFRLVSCTVVTVYIYTSEVVSRTKGGRTVNITRHLLRGRSAIGNR